MGIVLWLIVAAILTFFGWANQGNLVSFTLLPSGYAGPFGFKAVDVPVWGLIVGSAIVTAFICAISSGLTGGPLKRALRDKEQEVKETKDRLRRVETSLQDYEGRIHEFTLKVLELARSPHTAGQLEASIEEVESVRDALGDGKKE